VKGAVAEIAKELVRLYADRLDRPGHVYGPDTVWQKEFEELFPYEETADQLRKAGGFIPGVRPGSATAAYIKGVLDHITLPGAIFMAVLAVVPSILFSITGNTLMQSFGGTSVLILVGVAMDTISQLESQLKMHNYEGIFK
jgi:preprotein translocase subunit SecY